MSAAATLGTVLLVYLPAAVTPGPNFVLIAHTAAAGSRRTAAAVAAGVVVAGGLLASVAVLGLGALLASTPWLAHALRLVCGLYLAYLGIQLWRHARDPGPVAAPGAEPPGWWAAFRRGALSNVTNPKAAIFFGSVLTATLSPAEPLGLRLAAIAVIVAASAAWHFSVALLFSSASAQQWYGKAKSSLNRVVGVVLFALGIAFALR